MLDQPTILYIEDNPDNQRLVARVLEARGFRVMLADDGPSGIALAENNVPALVLVDMNIPTLDGYETATRLHSMAHLRATPVVALTADVQPGARERTLAAGCDGYISKPIDPRMLPQQVQEFIDGKRELLPELEETAMLRDYTRKLVGRLEEQVREVSVANKQLHELDKLKSQFIATVSHELRTPLTAILGYVELFERGTLGTLTPVQVEAMQVLGRNTRQLADQLNSLIYLQEVRASQVKRAPFLVHEVLRRVIGDLQHRADEGNVKIRAQLQPTALYEGDVLGIEHALRQVLDNSIKFTPEGGQVLVVIKDDPQGLIIRIRDNGIGIPPEIGDQVFQPFFQVDGSLARTRSGVGVGLAIVKHIIEAHNGEISLRSEPGKGTLVNIVLKRV